MKLTLRTLLAYLDDTLSPSEVKEIGEQVQESPYAQELIEKIRKVTRQRRLTVPSSTGVDATDPNLVADYLANALNGETMADFERKCLTSDVHLAEVASAHQILSMIGQKAKVPPEARYRMYRLIKGRESTGSRSRAHRVAQAIEASTAVADPLAPWTPPESEPVGLRQRLAPVGLVVLLLGLLTWSAWSSLRPVHPVRSPQQIALTNLPNQIEPLVPPQPLPQPAPANVPVEPNPATEAAKKAEGADMPPAKDVPKAEVPADEFGRVEQAEGVLLRALPDGAGWERLAGDAVLKADDRLVALSPSRHTIRVGDAKLDVFGGTDLTLRGSQPLKLGLTQGRVVLAGAKPPSEASVDVGGASSKITPPADTPIGLERLSGFRRGIDAVAVPALRVHATQGDVKVGESTFAGPKVVIVEDGKPEAVMGEQPGGWVVEPALAAFEKDLADQFAKNFKPNRPPKAALAEMIDSAPDDLKPAIIKGFGLLGETSEVILAMGRMGDPLMRNAAIETLQDLLARSPETAREVRSQLESVDGPDRGKRLADLLVGVVPQAGRESETYSNLVRGLTDDNLAIRELSIRNLQDLTNRDRLGYDPDQPMGEGLKAWQALQKENQLRPMNPPGLRPRPR